MAQVAKKYKKSADDQATRQKVKSADERVEVQVNPVELRSLDQKRDPSEEISSRFDCIENEPRTTKQRTNRISWEPHHRSRQWKKSANEKKEKS